MKDDIITDPLCWTSITKLELVPVGTVDALRRKFFRMRQKRNNKKQTLAALRLRHEELHQDYAALQKDYLDIKSAWEDLAAENERLKKERDEAWMSGYTYSPEEEP